MSSRHPSALRQLPRRRRSASPADGEGEPRSAVKGAEKFEGSPPCPLKNVVRQYIAGTREADRRLRLRPRRSEHDACGVGLVAALDGKRAPRRGRGGHRCAEGGVAPRRGRCRRQDRRRRGHPCRDPAGLLRATTCAIAPARERGARPHRRRHGLPAAHRSRRAGTLPHHRRDRDPALRLSHLWLAPGAGRHLGDRREGQRDAARDRADHDRPRRPEASTTREFEKRALHPAAGASRRRRSPRNIARVLHLLAVVPLADLQGHVPRRAVCRPSIRTCSTSASRRASRSSTSAIRPTPSRNGGWRSPSACSPTTARSTRSWATSTG